MVQRERLRNNIFSILICTAVACHQPAQHTGVPVYVNADSGKWKEKGPLLFFNESLFSGCKYRLYPNGDTASLCKYQDGKMHGWQLQWYDQSHLKEKRYFVNGWQQGVQQGWYANGRPRFEYHFKDDVYEGNVKEWSTEGLLFKDFNYAGGQESGKQLLLNNDGSIKANYEVRNGKIYGNIGSKNCESPWKN